jgi:hypothetical protein
MVLPVRQSTNLFNEGKQMLKKRNDYRFQNSTPVFQQKCFGKTYLHLGPKL